MYSCKYDQIISREVDLVGVLILWEFDLARVDFVRVDLIRRHSKLPAHVAKVILILHGMHVM